MLDLTQRAAADLDAAAAVAAGPRGGRRRRAALRVLVDASEAAFRVADLVSMGLRRERWLERHGNARLEALDAEALAPKDRVRALCRRARASNELGRGPAAARDASAALAGRGRGDARRAQPRWRPAASRRGRRSRISSARTRRATTHPRRPTAGSPPKTAQCRERSLPVVLNFVPALRYGDVATVCCAWGAAMRDECVRAKAVRAEASRWARAHQGGGGACSVAEGMREAHLLVAEHILAEHYDRRTPGSKVRAAVDAFLERLRLDQRRPGREGRQREITFRDAEKGPIQLQMTPSPTDYLDMDPETIPYNAPSGAGSADATHATRTSRRRSTTTASCSRSPIISSSLFYVEATAPSSTSRSTPVPEGVPMGIRRRDTNELPGSDEYRRRNSPAHQDRGRGPCLTLGILMMTRVALRLGWRYEGDDDAYDLVTRAFFDDRSSPEGNAAQSRMSSFPPRRSCWAATAAITTTSFLLIRSWNRTRPGET